MVRFDTSGEKGVFGDGSERFCLFVDILSVVF